jgi:uncharacterized protein
MDINLPGSASNEVVLPLQQHTNGNGTSLATQDMPKPVATADRIKTIDMIRGVALLGILLMNIPIFGIDTSVFDRVLRGPHNTADFHTMEVVTAFFDGTMRGLFSMLFGAGMVLFTFNKKEVAGGPTIAEYYYRRLLWLVAFGLVNAYIFLWKGDILFYYGLFGMLLFPFRKMRARWLIIIGLGCMCFAHIKGMRSYNSMRETRATYLEAVKADKAKVKLTEKQQEAKAQWEQIEKRQTPDTVNANKNIRKMHSGYGTIFNYFIPRNAGNETWGTYHAMWDMISMMFIGMGLLALGFFSNKLPTSVYTICLLLGYGLGIPIGYVFFSGAYLGPLNFGSYVDSYNVPHWALYDIRRILLCLGHISLLILVYRSKIVPWLMGGLANVGQMAFTNYLMQSLICTFFFFGYGFNYYDNLKFHQLYYLVAAVWLFQMIFSSVWLKYFRFGPFEWAWRSLTYWKAQPMKKERRH